MNRGAIFSDDRQYRYCLYRQWNEGKPMVMYIGLNPSTANENKNDNTITKLIKISDKNEFGGFYMLNLFAWISSKPEDLLTCENALGENDKYLLEYYLKVNHVVFCWGNFKEAVNRSKEVIDLFASQSKVNITKCLKQNKNGSPKHPLYCKDNSELVYFNFETLTPTIYER